MGFNMIFGESQEIIEAKRQGYIDGYNQAVKDMQERIKALAIGSRLLTATVTISSQKMVDVTVPERLYKAMNKAVENEKIK